MQKHDFFDLMVHTTDELEALLGESVRERHALHGWPFSSVERLTMESGVRWIYKTQRTPTLEPDFYEKARSPLLTDYRILTRDAVYSSLLFPFVDAPLLRDQPLSDAAFVSHARAVVAAIGQIRADVPVYIDIGSWERWRAFVDGTLDTLSQLTADGRLRLTVKAGDVEEVARWTNSDAVRRLIDDSSRLTHGDLNTGNVFLTDDGYRVIDWQRPQIAPADTDLAALLEGKPSFFLHTPPDVVGVFYFLRLFWAVNAKANLLPHLPQVFDRWSSEAIGFICQGATLSGH